MPGKSQTRDLEVLLGPDLYAAEKEDWEERRASTAREAGSGTQERSGMAAYPKDGSYPVGTWAWK